MGLFPAQIDHGTMTASDSFDCLQHAFDTRFYYTATSTAPQIGQKRRLSSEDPDDIPTPTSAKKLKADHDEMDIQDASQSSGPSSLGGKEGESVREVTKGVREVEIDETKKTNSEIVEEAAAVPLPDSPVLQPQADSTEDKPVTEEAKVDENGPVQPAEGAEDSEAAKSSAVEEKTSDLVTAETDAVSTEPHIEASSVATGEAGVKGDDILLKQVTVAVEVSSTVPVESVDTTVNA